jgi:hypothetical protein
MCATRAVHWRYVRSRMRKNQPILEDVLAYAHASGLHAMRDPVCRAAYARTLDDGADIDALLYFSGHDYAAHRRVKTREEEAVVGVHAYDVFDFDAQPVDQCNDMLVSALGDCVIRDDDGVYRVCERAALHVVSRVKDATRLAAVIARLEDPLDTDAHDRVLVDDDDDDGDEHAARLALLAWLRTRQ